MGGFFVSIQAQRRGEISDYRGRYSTVKLPLE